MDGHLLYDSSAQTDKLVAPWAVIPGHVASFSAAPAPLQKDKRLQRNSPDFRR